jgi:isoquinoline 1-oxidoreductase subunit alpha
MAYTIQVNGVERTVDVDGDMPLLWVLRDEFDLKGPKFGCGMGLCGACTVHVDGAAVRSCSLPVSAVGKSAVVTIEGIAANPVGRKLPAAWMATCSGQGPAGIPPGVAGRSVHHHEFQRQAQCTQ